MSTKSHILIVNSGGIRSLVATAAVFSSPDKPRVTVLHVRDGRGNAEARLEHARRQAEFAGVRNFTDIELPVLQKSRALQSADEQTPLVRTRVLLTAMAQAVSINANRIVWPVQSNADHALATLATEQAQLAQQLVELEHTPAPTLEMPLLDLTDKQVIELGAHMDVPWQLTWTCELKQVKPCRVCPPCRRRIVAFEEAGVPDPTDPAAANRPGNKAAPNDYNLNRTAHRRSA